MNTTDSLCPRNLHMFSFFKKLNKAENNTNTTKTETKTVSPSKPQPAKPTVAKPAEKPAAKPAPKAAKKAPAETPEQKKKLQEELKKCITDFTRVLRNETIGDDVVERIGPDVGETVESPYGLIVFGTKCYFSSGLLDGLKKYVPSGLPVVFVLDRTVKKDKEVHEKITALEQYPNVRSFYLSRGKTAKDRILLALNELNTRFIGILTLNDKINFRSFDLYVQNVLKEVTTESVVAFDDVLGNNLFRDSSLHGVSGLFFKKDFLKEKIESISANVDYWMSFYLLNGLKDSAVKTVKDKNKYFWSVEPGDFSVPDLAFFFRDAITIISLLKDSKQQLEVFIDSVIRNLANALVHKKISDNKLALMASGCAIFCMHLKKYYQTGEWRDIIYRFSILFDFDQLAKKAFMQNTHKKIVEAVFPVENNTVAVIETDFMQDLKESFLPALEQHFNVIYESKPQYYDYHFFYCMVIRAEIQPAQYVISSNDMHKFITGGKKVITLWHGLGMLKKIAEADRVKYPMNYIVTSSESCVEPWSQTFQLPVENVLPFGQVQTDILHDKKYLAKCSDSVRAEYSIPKDADIVFFAPTFRIDGTDKYYDMMVDIEELSKKLEENNTYLITKKHHVFSHILRDKGIDKSGVFNSKNGHFIVDEKHTFVELICASDKFITDYSSGVFYAFVRNLPIFLYAPDVNEYKEGANGFMIDYPKDIPVPFVGSGDIDAFIKALKDCESIPASADYKKFREVHVGSCDGKVAERLIAYFQSFK